MDPNVIHTAHTGEDTLRECMFTNHNDAHALELDSVSLVGRTDDDRGDAQKITVVAPLLLVDQELRIDLTAEQAANTANSAAITANATTIADLQLTVTAQQASITTLQNMVTFLLWAMRADRHLVATSLSSGVPTLGHPVLTPH